MKLAVQIERFVDAHQPGWVEAEFVDAAGKRHRFLDKVPIFTINDLDATSRYPQLGHVRCEALSESRDVHVQIVVRINTARPDGVESTDGLSQFTVFPGQLSD